MTWWWWVLGGLGLLGIEILTPGGFVAMFFGVAAVTVGLLAAGDLVTAAWAQWFLFSVVSIGALLLFRNPLLRALDPAKTGSDDGLLGELATITEAVALGGVGKAELRGTHWTVRNDDTRALGRGERARVVRVDGLTLWIRAEAPEGGRS